MTLSEVELALFKNPPIIDDLIELQIVEYDVFNKLEFRELNIEDCLEVIILV